jgi:hypothetical protein
MITQPSTISIDDGNSISRTVYRDRTRDVLIGGRYNEACGIRIQYMRICDTKRKFQIPNAIITNKSGPAVPKFAANLTLLFNEVLLIERFGAAEAGSKAAEFFSLRAQSQKNRRTDGAAWIGKRVVQYARGDFKAGWQDP